MALKAGIVGLPNVGKSTLFNAITNSQIEAANYPFATIEPNVGIVELPDSRIDKLVTMVEPDKTIKATFEFIDIAGLVEGASKGEGLGNKFLANIRETDAIIQVVRCFKDENITHVSGTVDPIRDAKIINLELLLADIDTLENIVKRTESRATRSNDKDAKFEFDLASMLKTNLENEIPARKIELNKDQEKLVKGWNLLSKKPMLYVANVAEEFISNPADSELYKTFEQFAKENDISIIGISAQIEFELSQLDGDDKTMFLDDLGVNESGLNKITRAAFNLLNLSTYFTSGKVEVRAWTFKNGMSAPNCAGIIHTDFEKGFIRAEIISYDDFVKNGGEQGAKDAGKSRLEGKDYIMQDGDIVNFRFNN